LVLVDQVAQGQVVAGDHTVDGRRHAAETEIELVDFQAGLGRLDTGLALFHRRPVLVELLRADRTGRLGDFEIPAQGRLGQLQLRLVKFDLSLA